jgi:hypothetical protein
MSLEVVEGRDSVITDCQLTASQKPCHLSLPQVGTLTSYIKKTRMLSSQISLQVPIPSQFSSSVCKDYERRKNPKTICNPTFVMQLKPQRLRDQR